MSNLKFPVQEKERKLFLSLVRLQRLHDLKAPGVFLDREQDIRNSRIITSGVTPDRLAILKSWVPQACAQEAQGLDWGFEEQP